jgi:rSAM/selenodomain-associated transferase 1
VDRAFNTEHQNAAIAWDDNSNREASMELRSILLFVKLPEPGRVKTRLAATIGPMAAAEVYRKLVAKVVSALPTATGVTVMFDPPESATAVRDWLSPSGRSFDFAAQCAGDLGTRLSDAFVRAFARGAQKVAAIGGDCIDLSAATFAATWRALDDHDAVIGPTTDGGYYLIASQRPLPLFHPVAWSSSSVLAETMALARTAGLRVHLLPILDDIDTADDWRRVQARLPD